MSFYLLFLISIVAGFIGAMSGMGGVVVLIPAMTLFGMNITIEYHAVRAYFGGPLMFGAGKERACLARPFWSSSAATCQSSSTPSRQCATC